MELKMEMLNATIKSAKLLVTEQGFLSVEIQLQYAVMSQMFGGYVLYLPKSFKNHEKKSVAGMFIHRCMELAGVTEWSKMSGRNIRVMASETSISGIGHIINDDWFYPEKEF